MKKLLVIGFIMAAMAGCSSRNVKDLNINSKDNLLMENVNSDRRDLEDIIVFNEDGVSIRREGNNLILTMEENVLFDLNQAQVKNRIKPALNTLSRALKENPDIRIKIDGYTCNLGSENHNLELSLNRSKAIKEYMMLRGVVPNNVTVEGYGESDPKASNETEELRAQNRRVEFIISRAY
ncbi:MAG: OmpA family protein [Fusobacteriaceae bacterium]